MLVDTHCHLASSKFDGEVLDLVTRARERGVSSLVTQSTCLADLEENLELAAIFPEVKVAAGIHPCDVHETPDTYLPDLLEACNNEHVVAVGETGLDYYHQAPEGWTDEAYHERQRDFLNDHFELAERFGLPVVLHTRDRSGHQSFDDALSIAADFQGRVKCVFHCFPGPWALAERALDIGAYLSFTGIATFKNAASCLEAAVNTPAGRIMVETDAPYLAPTPHRGQRCEPAYVRDTAEFIAAARGESFEEFAAHTTATAQGFFRGL